MDVLQRVVLTLAPGASDWLATGITLGAGESLRVESVGIYRYGTDAGELSFPEGSYRFAGEGTDLYHTEEPERVDSYAQLGSGGWLVSNTAPLSLVLVVAQSKPPWAVGQNGLRPNRNRTFAPGEFPTSGGSVWVAFNEVLGELGNDSGGFTVTLERLGTAPLPALNPGQVSPVRFVPPIMAAIKARTIQRSAVCWFVQPKTGPPEGYTEWDAPIECPQYVDATGSDDAGAPLYSTIPALTYKPFAGLDITSVPTSIKLGVDAPDIDIVRFDLRKLRREYYEDAFVEVFEIPLDTSERFAPSGVAGRSNRLIYLTGTLGNAQGVDGDESGYGSATIELTPFEELLNTPIGGTICQLCPAPFGRGGCRNQVLLDGPDIEALTRGAQVATVIAPSKLVLASQSVAGYSGFGSDFPASHGILQFRGGALDGLKRDIGSFDGATGEIILRRALPFPPEIGDTLTIEAGCDHTFDGPRGCGYWNNRLNFRAFPHVPGRAALTRRFTT